MNFSTAAVLVVIAVLLALAIASMVRKNRKGGCGDCADEGCSFHGTDHEPEPGEILPDGTVAACPAVDRALKSVDAILDADPSTAHVKKAS